MGFCLFKIQEYLKKHYFFKFEYNQRLYCSNSHDATDSGRLQVYVSGRTSNDLINMKYAGYIILR